MRTLKIVLGLLGLLVLANPASAQYNMQGMAPTGSAPVGYPIYIAGWDGTNIRPLKTDSNGQILVGTGTGNQNVIPFAIYNTSPPSPTNGTNVQLQADSQGNLKMYMASAIAGEDLTNNVLGTVNKVPVASTYSPSSYQSAASGSQVVSANIKASAGQLMSFTASNGNGTVRYLWITNATTAPAGSLASSDASVKYIIPILGTTAIDRGTTFFTVAGVYFSTGISFGFSTSATSYTAATATDHMLDVNYY